MKRMGIGILENPNVAETWKRATRCTACGECMTRCPYGLPIPDMIRENIEWMDAFRRGNARPD